MKSFQQRLSLSFFRISIFVLLTSIVVSFFSFQYVTNTQLSSARQFLTQALYEEVTNKSDVLMKTLAKNLYDPLYRYDFKSIDQLLLHSAENEAITAIYLTDKNWNIIHNAKSPINTLNSPIEGIGIQRPDKHNTFQQTENRLILFEPVGSDQSVLGYVVASFSLESLNHYHHQLDSGTSQLKKNLTRFLIVVYLIAVIIIIIMTFQFSRISSRRLAKPIQKLATAAKEIGKGNHNIDLNIEGDREIQILAKSLHRMNNKLITTMKRERQLAYFDSVTDLPNRHSFQQTLTNEISTRKEFAVMFFDLDDFKIVNDTLGHASGDEVLAAFGNRLLNRLNKHHQLDIPLYRIGGDEFVLIIPKICDNDCLEKVGNTCIGVVHSPFVIGDDQCSIGVSIGAAIYPNHGDDDMTLISNADKAMYLAKQSGKNQLVIFDPDHID